MKRIELLKILKKPEELFDGTLGTSGKYPVDTGLKEYVNPNPLPNVQKYMFKKEVERIILLIFHEKANDSELGSL